MNLLSIFQKFFSFSSFIYMDEIATENADESELECMQFCVFLNAHKFQANAGAQEHFL